MNTTPQPSRLSHAFTLVELLTVIAIIAILMGLLFPTIGIVKNSARKQQAKSDCLGIVTAVKNYYTEYGKYPQTSTTASTTDILVGGDSENNETLFNTLRSIPTTPNDSYKLNPRRIVYMEGRSVSDATKPKGGFVDQSGASHQGGFYDPWGRQYLVAIDGDYDNQITNLPYTDFSGTAGPRVGCAAASMGIDDQLGTKGDKVYRKDATTTSDDVISWQN